MINRVVTKNILNIHRNEMFKNMAAMYFVFALANSLFSGDIPRNYSLWFASGCLIAAYNTKYYKDEPVA